MFFMHPANFCECDFYINRSIKNFYKRFIKPSYKKKITF